MQTEHSTAARKEKKAQPWYLQLWFQVLVAMAIGIALGHVYPDLGARMQPLGDAFIKAIRVVIAPIIFCTVVHGISSMANMAKVGRVALKALIYFEVLTTMLFRIVAVVMWAAPLGAFGAIAFTVGKFGTASLLSLGELLLSFYLTCLIFVFGVLWPIAHWCGFSLFKFIRYIWEELLIVFATTSSETVLPRMIAKLEDAGCEESVVGLVIPTGYSFNLDGTCLYLATAAVFLAQATNTPLAIEQQLGLLAVLLLASKGAAGVAGAAFVVLAATLASVGTIPVESVALILGVHRLMSEGLTPTNLIGNGVATLVIAKWENALDERRLQQVLDRKIDPAILAQPQPL